MAHAYSAVHVRPARRRQLRGAAAAKFIAVISLSRKCHVSCKSPAHFSAWRSARHCVSARLFGAIHDYSIDRHELFEAVLPQLRSGVSPNDSTAACPV